MTTIIKSTQQERVTRLREIIQRQGITVMPCCYDGLSAKLIERAGFEVTFMSGFGVSAVHGFPDTQLLSFSEMERAARNVCESLNSIPCFGDGDTGYGSALNIKRTVAAYAAAGMAGIMLEDQVAPKRCGHTKGKTIVSREEAFARIKAAVDARKEGNFDIVIMARTDARGTHGMDEAIYRAKEFMALGADMTFLEAPRSVDEMKQYCESVPGPKLANMLEKGLTPIISPEELGRIGFNLVAYPLTLLSASIKVMEECLYQLQRQTPANGYITSSDSIDAKKHDNSAPPSQVLNSLICDFEHVKDVVGFNEYYEQEARYSLPLKEKTEEE